MTISHLVRKGKASRDPIEGVMPFYAGDWNNDGTITLKGLSKKEDSNTENFVSLTPPQWEAVLAAAESRNVTAVETIWTVTDSLQPGMFPQRESYRATLSPSGVVRVTLAPEEKWYGKVALFLEDMRTLYDACKAEEAKQLAYGVLRPIGTSYVPEDHARGKDVYTGEVAARMETEGIFDDIKPFVKGDRDDGS